MDEFSKPRRGLNPTPAMERELQDRVEVQPGRDQAHEPLVVSHWLKYGRHLLGVSTLEGARVGWVDLASGQRSVMLPELEAAFEAAVAAAAVDSAAQYTPRRALAQTIPA